MSRILPLSLPVMMIHCLVLRALQPKLIVTLCLHIPAVMIIAALLRGRERCMRGLDRQEFAPNRWTAHKRGRSMRICHTPPYPRRTERSTGQSRSLRIHMDGKQSLLLLPRTLASQDISIVQTMVRNTTMVIPRRLWIYGTLYRPLVWLKHGKVRLLTCIIKLNRYHVRSATSSPSYYPLDLREPRQIFTPVTRRNPYLVEIVRQPCLNWHSEAPSMDFAHTVMRFYPSKNFLEFKYAFLIMTSVDVKGMGIGMSPNARLMLG